MIFASISAHGVTGTWLDEILELGVPLVLLVGLWWWSTRKDKKKAKSTPGATPSGAPSPGAPTPSGAPSPGAEAKK